MGLWQTLGGRAGFLSATGILLLIGIAYLFAVSPFVSAQGENPATGELETDDPPVSFRVTGQGDDWIGVAWEVPRDRASPTTCCRGTGMMAASTYRKAAPGALMG